jgi:hypothetical protein
VELVASVDPTVLADASIPVDLAAPRFDASARDRVRVPCASWRKVGSPSTSCPSRRCLAIRQTSKALAKAS